MSASEEQLVGHSYTRARRHPLVIGKLPGAGRLPGGPYTITQVMTMVITFAVLVMTKGVWARFGVMNFLLLIALPWGLAWVLRYARMDGRDPARALRSLLTYSSTPAQGRLAGKPQRASRPRLAVGTCTVHVRTSQPHRRQAPAPVTAPAAARKAAPVRSAPARAAVGAAPARRSNTPPAAGQPPRTGLQSLLASLDEH